MKFAVSTIATIWLLLDISETTRPDHDLELIFRDRSRSDWQNHWHKEKYARCRETLIRHLYWACEKDIYRITRRNDPTYRNEVEDLNFPWILPKKAKKFLGLKRSGASITNECCKSTGCTWEEYAEYCPTNKRQTSIYNSL